MDILRFITAGSVDDGKSTLIGRLLHDSKSIMIDQLQAIEKQSKNMDEGEIDLALLTDGLRAEREQGITIDIAYKYFSTPNRKFIIADAPGHIQYTRNMITGASNSDLAIILIDAENGVIEQTKRHSIIAYLLGIKHIVVTVNKMDLVNYSQEVFDRIVTDYKKAAELIGIKNVTFIPISAKKGDNIVDRSKKLEWYKGDTLLTHLENVKLDEDIDLENPRFPVQFVIRPQTIELRDYRGYAGKIISGIYRKNDKITVLPSGVESRISKIEVASVETEEAFAPQSVVLHLETDVDISRGDMIVNTQKQPEVGQDFDVVLCWMSNQKLVSGNKYLLQIGSRRVKSVIKGLEYKIDVNTMLKDPSPEQGSLNDLVRVKIKTASPIAYDSFQKLKVNGCAILIDETSNSTVAACMIQ
jgi:sulfate adenylyltransferase subunit 1